MSASLKATVIVCTYTPDRVSLLHRAIDGVMAQARPRDELILVVDHNAALAAKLRTSCPTARVVESDHPRGLSGARNAGIAAATGDVLVFLDDDAVPRDGWLAGLLAPFEDPSIAGVGGRAAPAWELGHRPHWFPEELDWVVGCSFRGQAGGDVRNPIGCSMAFRADVLARVGGFTTELGRVGTLPLGCEETELGLRVNAAGGRIVLVDESIVDHFVPLQRSRLRYVLRRCYSEGVSKAAVRRLAAGDGALAPERSYVLVLLRAVLRALLDGARTRSAVAAAPAFVIPAAGAAAVSGYLRAAA